MITATIQQTAGVGGLSIQGNVSRNGDSQVGYSSDPALPVALAGELTTRTDEDTGVVTLAEGHGLTDADTVDVFWDGGLRYGLSITGYDATTINIDGGAGDDLPLAETVVAVAEPVAVPWPFAGDDVVLIAAGCAQRASVRFLDDVPSVQLALDLAAGEVWSWATGSANPLDSVDVVSLLVSNGDTATEAIVRVGAALDSQE
jgi:hypothetical protein